MEQFRFKPCPESLCCQRVVQHDSLQEEMTLVAVAYGQQSFPFRELNTGGARVRRERDYCVTLVFSRVTDEMSDLSFSSRGLFGVSHGL